MVDSNDKDSAGHICYKKEHGPEVAKRFFLKKFCIVISKAWDVNSLLESYIDYWIYSSNSKFKFSESRIHELKKERALSKLLDAWEGHEMDSILPKLH